MLMRGLVLKILLQFRPRLSNHITAPDLPGYQSITSINLSHLNKGAAAGAMEVLGNAIYGFQNKLKTSAPIVFAVFR